MVVRDDSDSDSDGDSDSDSDGDSDSDSDGGDRHHPWTVSTSGGHLSFSFLLFSVF